MTDGVLRNISSVFLMHHRRVIFEKISNIDQSKIHVYTVAIFHIQNTQNLSETFDTLFLWFLGYRDIWIY